jgi:hypothetical protein
MDYEINGRKRVIVCAACKYTDVLLDDGTLIESTIITGARHMDSIMQNQLRNMPIAHKKISEQGFIDQWGNFLTREEAMAIVIKNNQKFDIERNGHNNKKLFSEGLY